MKLTHPRSEQTIDVAAEHADRYLEQGWRPATTEAPAGNAALADWQEFARSQGFAEADIEGKTRDQLRSALS